MKKLLSILIAVTLGMSLTACKEKSKNKSDDNRFTFEYKGFYTAGIDFNSGTYKLVTTGSCFVMMDIISFTEDNEPVKEHILLSNAETERAVQNVDEITFDKGTVVCITDIAPMSEYCFEPIKIIENVTKERENTAVIEKTLEAGEYEVSSEISPGTYDLYLEEALISDDETSWVNLDFENRKNKMYDDYDYSHFSFANEFECSWAYKNVPFNEGDIFTIENGSIRFVPSK